MPNMRRRATDQSTGGKYHVGVIFYFVFISLWSTDAILAENRDVGPSSTKVIRFAALQGLYPNVSRKDGRMALEIIMQKAIVKKSYPYSVELHFIDSGDDVIDALKTEGYHFLTLPSIDFYKYHNSVYLDPILIPSSSDQPTETLLFLINEDQSISTIAQKEERTLIIENGRNGDLSKIWLNAQLFDHGLPECDLFFTKIRRVQKQSRAILPVFFNQAQACVVTQNAFEAIKELNPQIGSKVKQIFQSEGLVRLMICATSEPDKIDIQIFKRESLKMDNNPDTQQAMTILKVKRFLEADPEILRLLKSCYCVMIKCL